MRDIKISLATAGDLERIMVLFKEFEQEAPDHHYMDEEKLRATIAASFDDDNQVIITFKVDGEIVGMLYGILTEPFMSHKRVASELAWFVTKEHRGRGAISMVDVFEQWAIFKGATSVVMADIEKVSPLGPLYKKLGFSKVETAYHKEI